MFIYTGYTQQYDSNIPLQSIAVNASLVDVFGEVTIAQTYKNNYSRDIEAIYCFNLDKNSSVTRMVLVLNGKRMISEIKEKTQAKSTYSSAKAEHKTTCLLEYNSDGSYKVSLGNIQAGQEIVVELTYVTTLDYSNGVARFILPTNISQKYGGSSNKTVMDLLSATMSSLTHSSQAKYSFSFNLNYKSYNSVIDSIKSQTNEIQVTPVSENEVNVTSTSMPSNGDFNLLIQTALQPGLYYNTQGPVTYMAVTHKIPDDSLDIMTVEKEFIFVIDRSGSMDASMRNWSGNSSQSKTKIELAKEALVLFINSLPPKSTFNIYSFGNTFKSLFPRSLSVTNENVKTALDGIATFGADMGGTEIFKCLESIFAGNADVPPTPPPINLSKREWKPDPATEYEKVEIPTVSSVLPREKVLILLTDGQVSNSDAVIGLCEQYNYLARVFCIGIGADVDRNLVTSISSVSHGYSDVLVDNDNVSSTVVKMLDSSLKTYYKFVGANIGGQRTTEQVLYPNQSFSCFKMLPTESFKNLSEIVVSGINGVSGDTVSWTASVLSKSESPDYLRQLWAHDRIKSFSQDNARNKHANEIIKLSVENSIATKYTSFVVVDEVVHANQNGEPLTVNVPQYADSRQDECERFEKMSLQSAPSMRGGSYVGRTLSSSSSSYGAQSVKKSKAHPNSSGIFSSFTSYFSRSSKEDDDEADEEDQESESIQSQAKSLQQQSATFSQKRSVMSDERSNAEPQRFGKLVSGSTSSNNVEYLLNFKNSDGSFKYDEKVLKTIGVSVSKFNTVVTNRNVSQVYLTNVLVLAYLKLVNDEKFKMIQKMLESWLSSNKSVEISESTTSSLFTV